MYNNSKPNNRKIFPAIIILAAIFIIYANYVYGASEVKNQDKKFRSEEELIDETRQAVNAYLNDVEEDKSVVSSKNTAKYKKAEQPPASPGQPQGPAGPGNIQLPTKQEPPKEVKQIVMEEKQEEPREVEFVLDKKAITGEALEQPVLKKMELEKIGATPYYETYEGLRLLKYFTVAQRVEIYQEPRPIDSYILDAHAMRYLYGIPWDIDSDYRTQLTPIFTRAYGTEFTVSDPKNKEGQIRYTHDYREIYKNYWPKYQYGTSYLKKEMWDQNEILLMHAKEIEPIGWLYTSNIGYRYSTMSAKSDINYYEIRHTYFSSLSLSPTDKIEYFFQGEYYKSMHLKASYDYRPDHFLGRTEVRIKSNDYKTMFVPQFSYSKDLYYPFANSFEKYEIALRVGRDFTKRFSASSTLQYVYSFRDEPDNTAPTYAFKNPIKDKAEYISLQNRFSYNIYDRLYLQAGLDIANGLNWSIFDNWGLLGGIEYYVPGMIRVDVGWRGNHYYNLDDFMSSLYFKFYLFM